MTRFLVAFEAPDTGGMGSETYEEAWDSWVRTLHSRGLQLANDIDPVAVVGDIEVYEAVALK